MDKILRSIIFGGVFLSLFLPTFVSNGIFFPFISGKNFAFRIITEIIFAAWLILMLRAPEYRPRWSLIGKALLVFVAVIALADIFGVSSYKSFWSNFERMEGLIGLLHLLAYFFVVSSMVRSEKLWGLLFHTSIGVSLFISFFAVLQIGGELAINQGGLRVDATLGNAIYLAVYLLFHLFLVKKRIYGPKELFKSIALGSGMFILYYLARTAGSDVEAHTTGVVLSTVSILTLLYSMYMLRSEAAGLQKISRMIFEWGLVVLYITIIVYTATRGVIIGLAASLLTLGILLVFSKDTMRPSLHRRVGAGILVFFALSGVAFFTLRDIPSIKNHRIFSRIASISATNDDAVARFRVWNMAWKGLKERPLLGWGQENFNYVFNKYYDPKMYAREQWFDRTHNVFFDWLIAGGILGLLAYLALFFALFRHIWKAPRGKEGDAAAYTLSYVEKSVLTALATGYFFQNFFVFDNLTSYLMFFLLLSYIHFVATARHEDHKVAGGERERPFVRLASALIFVGLVFSLYFLNVKPIIAGATLIKALRPYPASEGGVGKNIELFKKALKYSTFASTEIREQLAQLGSRIFGSDQVDTKIKNDFFNLGYNELKQQLEKTPDDARYQLFTGVFLNAAGKYDEASQYLEKAVALSPAKQSILFELGTSFLNQGRFDKALEVFKKAFELEPSFSDARIIYALGAVYAGNIKLSDEILTEGFGTTLYFDERLAQAYFRAGQFKRLIDIYQKKIETEPSNGQLYLRLGGVYLQNGNKQKAIDSIKKAMEIDPNLKAAGEGYIKEINAGRTQ